MKERFKTPAAVLLMLMRKNGQNQEEILLQKRQNTGYMDGHWDFSATGHVENNESMLMAMIREAKEELGLDIQMEDLEFITIIHKHIDTIYYNGYFKATKWTGTPRANEPEKCEEVKWFSLDNLPENIIDDRWAAIKNYKNNIKYSEYGWDYKN